MKNPIGLLTVIVKVKYYKHTYWRYVSDLGTFLMIERNEIRAAIFNELLTHSPNCATALTYLERIDAKPNFKRLPSEYVVFNKLALCCLIDDVIDTTLLTVSNEKRRESIDRIIRKIILTGAKNKVADSQEEVASFLALTTPPLLEDILIKDSE